MAMIKERYGNDRVKQQQAMMELYKKEQINPVAGCLPIVIQISVFFSLYKVLFVTIEMRHAPFYGWIYDPPAGDPTTFLIYFGLIPFDPQFIELSASRRVAVMGVTMWVQMKLNPAPPISPSRLSSTAVPIVFTFMLAELPAGLVIYWAWTHAVGAAAERDHAPPWREDLALADSKEHLHQAKAQAAGGVKSSGLILRGRP